MQNPITRVALLLAAALSLGGCGTRGQDQATQDTARAGGEISNAQLATARNAPAGQTAGQIEPVAVFTGPMPTGVTVSREGRIFVNFPKWGDDVDFTVAEIRNGRAVPYPNAEINR